MRKNRNEQMPLCNDPVDHPMSQELETISRVLDDNSTICDLVAEDLSGGRKFDTGREGMTAEQVVRCAILKRILDCDYRELEFHLRDSTVAQRFSRLPYGKKVNFRTLQQNIKRIKESTWEKINRVLMGYAKEKGIENGSKSRTDCTVVEANIHRPTDSSLLVDCIRVLGRLISRAREEYPKCRLSLRDHLRAAKRRAMEILHGKNEKKRRKAYRKLIPLCEETVGYGREAVVRLRSLKPIGVLDRLAVESLADEIEHYVAMSVRVIDQTRRRVLLGEQVPAQEKIVSIFEPHTDIIVKDRRDTLYGHKVCITTGASCLITDCVVEKGNPADSTLVNRALERHNQVFGRYPRQAAFDGGFASKENLAVAKSKPGVKDVAFAKKRNLKVLDMVKSPWVYRKLRRFRAGVEGCISAVKRICGLDICTWKGHEGFKRYVHCGVVAFNLLVIARHLLA
jgi:IS5 family transposase